MAPSAASRLALSIKSATRRLKSGRAVRIMLHPMRARSGCSSIARRTKRPAATNFSISLGRTETTSTIHASQRCWASTAAEISSPSFEPKCLYRVATETSASAANCSIGASIPPSPIVCWADAISSARRRARWAVWRLGLAGVIVIVDPHADHSEEAKP